MSLRIAIVTANTFEFDTRALRMARSLASDGHTVHVLALSRTGLPVHEVVADRLTVTRLVIDGRIVSALRPLPEALRSVVARALGMDPSLTTLPTAEVRGLDRIRHPLRRLLELSAHARRTGPWTRAVMSAAPATDVFQTETLLALPVVRRAARLAGGRHVYDFADYQTEAARIARLPWVIREVLRRRERGWAREASSLMAASNGLAQLVARRLDVSPPSIVMNCSPPWRPAEAEPRSNVLRDALALPSERPVVLYHGHLTRHRGIEELITAANQPALVELDAAVVIMGFGGLKPWLQALASDRPGRIFVLPAVPPDALPEWISGADVSYVGFPPRTLNLRLTLPNKLFESLMAGVPVVCHQGTATSQLVAAERVGRATSAQSAHGLASDICALLLMPDAERRAIRRRCRKLALGKYSWAHRERPLLDLYRRLAREEGTRPERSA